MNHKQYHKIYIPFPLIDIYKINWNKNMKSKIHDHSKYGCIMFLYQGILKENIYCKNLNRIRTNIHISPKITYINDNIGYHNIKPLKDSKSIHFYFPKNHQTKYFD
jgi:hypothetical protein